MGLSDSNTTPGYTTLLCSALDCGNIDGIGLYCKDTYGGGVVVVMVIFDSNTYPGEITLFCSALDCGNKANQVEILFI